MNRITLTIVAVLALALSGAVIFGAWQYNRASKLSEALKTAREYIDTRKETDDALSDLPDDPDLVLKRLCEIAGGGEGCGNP